jgi:transcriptional regulator with XRE-family HTH domain
MKARELFGKRVLTLRKSQSLTQNDLAFKSGLGREYISTVECGKRNISINAIEKIADALNVSIKELFDFEDHLSH